MKCQVKLEIKNDFPEFVNINGIKTCNKIKISDEFCKYFSNISGDLEGKIPRTDKGYKEYLNNSDIHSQNSIF